MSATLRRGISAEVRVLDSNNGVCEYVASDQSIDTYKEVIAAGGWRFNRFERNAPLVDSHRYDSIETVLGKVIDARVSGGQLREMVQWAVDVPNNRLAQLGWEMTKAGFLKAVSVGFVPVRTLSRSSSNEIEFQRKLVELGLPADSDARTIYLEQEQIELSAVVIGANSNALLCARNAKVIDDGDLDFLFAKRSVQRSHGHVRSTADPIERMICKLRTRLKLRGMLHTR
ncbi:MAG TPA: hypothetical protein P5555_17325 [Candidatus Paceibacterota bacterium]|nr:hypothetical protein [Verrucomicrobiota bacterium]HRZ46941.1 hypothetical protein [Candidatus Paceibacterota bacterium]HRZ92107.1 hypothetical protein [Candidatus Paceibacterota bacterium]